MAKSSSRFVPLPAPRPARPRRDYWRVLVEECRRSGLSQAEFCRRRSIPPGTLSFWKYTLSREAGGAPRSSAVPARTPERLGFVPVQITSTRPLSVETQTGSPTDWGGEIEIAMDGGRLVRVRGRVDPQCLRQVILTLGSTRC